MRSFGFISKIAKCHGLVAAFAILVAGESLFPSSACWAEYVFSLDNSRARRNSYPVTELKMVHEPGNFHYVRTYDESHVLTDYWWKELTVGNRTYEPPRYPQQPQFLPPHNPYPQPGPQYSHYNGVVQDLGDGQGLENVDVAVYWERDKSGGVQVYKEGAATSSVEESDVWGAQIK